MSRATALVAAALPVAAEIPAAGQGGWHNGWLAAIYEVIGIAAVLVAGLYINTRRAYLAELRDRTQRLEREHDQTSALAAAVERARIARELEGLFTRVRAAGLPVRYERSGPPGDTPPGVQLVIFRLVQEALTNTMKHAGPGASAAVRLRLEPGEVRVEVEDDGVGTAGVTRAPGGGLTGMAERVGAFGGELTCGPRQPRGWRVTARLDPGTAVSA